MATGEGYVELRCASCFSFLRGASHPEELWARAAALGHRRLALTDVNGLYGVVRAFNAGQANGVDVVAGAELHLSDGPRLVVLPSDRAAYGRVCRLLSQARLATGKGGFRLTFDDLAARAEGLIALHLGPARADQLAREKDAFGERLHLALERTFTPRDAESFVEAEAASRRFDVPLVATGAVVMHERARKPLQDILTCIRVGKRIDDAGRHLLPNGMGYLRSAAEMKALFPDHLRAVARTVDVADACRFRLDELVHDFTLEVLPEGETGLGYLRKLVEKGARERYPGGVPEEVRRQIEHEMQLIEELRFEGYFLTVWDIVRFARSRGILCQGRGSAANSIVCYCLGITAIDPVRMNLLFERFISAERGEPPDIDVDFEHQRREEVMQYVFDKYGRDRAAMVANLICYRSKLAYREVGKVMGLGDDQIERINQGRGHWSSGPITDDDLARAGLDPRDRRVRSVLRWAEELRGFPRHLGLHSGGFVITRDPIVELVPVENAAMEDRTVIAWDKRDVETLGLVKVDLLALGMLSVVRRAFDLIRETEGRELTLATIPAEIDAVYAMIGDADTIGTFQVESRAQMQTLPRLRPRTFYDLVVAVAIIRPGPIQGDMVHPYLRRREGLEPVDYPHPELEKILGRTYGLPLFQEQVMKMAVHVAGFSPGEADHLRRAIGWNSQLHIDRMRERIIDGMIQNGIEPEFADRIFKMIQGFGGYGFPESHAASFALIGYASCYLKRYHPAAFLAALLDSQPMGFYGVHTLVEDGKRHGLEIRPPCVVRGGAWSSLEPASDDRAVELERWFEMSPHREKHHTPWADRARGAAGRESFGRAVQPAVRIGLREIAKMSEPVAERIVEARTERPFIDVTDVLTRADVPKDAAVHLASSGAFDALGVSRREALWGVLSFDRGAPLFRGIDASAPSAGLRPMDAIDAMKADYRTTGLSTRQHPMALLRAELRRRGVLGYLELERVRPGKRVRVGGMVTVRQRPGTAKGVVFMTLEDEDGQMNLVVFPKTYARHRAVARDAILLVAEGRVERRHRVTNVIVDRFVPLEGPRPEAGVSRDFFDGRA